MPQEIYDVLVISEEVSGLTAAHAPAQSGLQVATFSARQIVIASGARLKNLGVPGQADFEGRGVSQCADCDVPMYQNQDVVVVGDGADATRAEEFRESDKQVDRQHEQIAYESNVITPANLRKAARKGPLGPEFRDSRPTGSALHFRSAEAQ